MVQWWRHNHVVRLLVLFLSFSSHWWHINFCNCQSFVCVTCFMSSINFALNTMAFRKKQYMVCAYYLQYLTAFMSSYGDEYQIRSSNSAGIKMLVSNYMQNKLVWKRMDIKENSVQRAETKIWWSDHIQSMGDDWWQKHLILWRPLENMERGMIKITVFSRN